MGFPFKKGQQKKLRIIQHSLQYRKPDSLDAPVNSDAASDSNTAFRNSSQAITSGITRKFQRQGRHYGETMDKILHDMPARDACVLRLDSDWRMVVLIPSKKSGTKWT